MTEEFNSWWNSDELLMDNPYRKDSPAYWAWEGWCAAVNAEREQCVKICCEHWLNGGNAMECADAIRARGQE
jgi:hypothetical protein